MGEARRRKLAEPNKIEQQSADGVIMLTFNVEPIPLLHCILPIRNTMKQLNSVMSDLSEMPYEGVLAAVRGELTAANQQQDETIIQSASMLGLYATLYNPLFGIQVRALLDEVRRNRHSLGLMVLYHEDTAAFGINTGIANIAMDMIGKPQQQEKFPTPETMASEAWRTHVDPKYTEGYGVSELHMVLFESTTDRAGISHTVCISIPETPENEIRHALDIATKADARISFTCDTAEQAEAMAAYAAPLLPNHRRIAYERAEAGKWGSLL